MHVTVIEPFDYCGKLIEPGIVEVSDAEFRSMMAYGIIRPATSTEIEESQTVKKPRKK